MPMKLRDVILPHLNDDATAEEGWEEVADKLTLVLDMALADQEPADGVLWAGLINMDEVLTAANDARCAVMAYVANELIDLPKQRLARLYALTRQADALLELGQRGKAIRVHRGIVDQFGAETDDLRICGQVAQSQLFIAAGLEEKSRYPQALALYDAIIARHGDATDPVLRISVANARLYRSTCVYDISEEEDAEPTIERWEAIIREYENDTVPGICDLVGLTYEKLSEVVSNHHGDAAAIAIVDRMVAWAARPDITPPQERVSEALLTKYATHYMMEDAAGAMATAQTILDRLPVDGDAVDRLITWMLSEAEARLAEHKDPVIAGQYLQQIISRTRALRHDDEMLGQRISLRWGDCLREADYPDAALAFYRHAAQDWRDDRWIGCRLLTAIANTKAGIVLDGLGRHDEELRHYDAVIADWQEDDGEGLICQQAVALNNKRITLADQDDWAGADAAADLMEQRCHGFSHFVTRDYVASNFFYRVDRALANDNVPEMLRVRCAMVDYFAHDTDPEILTRVIPVVLQAARGLLIRNDSAGAVRAYSRLWLMLPHVQDPDDLVQICLGLVEFGRFQHSENQFDDAVATLSNALATFQDLRTSHADVDTALVLAEQHLQQCQQRRAYRVPTYPQSRWINIIAWGLRIFAFLRRGRP